MSFSFLFRNKGETRPECLQENYKSTNTNQVVLRASCHKVATLNRHQVPPHLNLWEVDLILCSV